jgi:DNA-binding HxlR family transcriptional regulator
VADLLSLIGDGVNGLILMALGPRSLRTKKLTEKVPTCAPRTVYRHARRLAELGLIDRQETEGVPSTVVHRLSPAGRDLYRLLDDFCQASPSRLSAPGAGEGVWRFCGLLGEMLANGWVEALSREALSATELAELTPGMSIHQGHRRIQQLISWNLLYVGTARVRDKRYLLSDQTRYGMALVTALGHWRQRHLPGAGPQGGLDVREMATALRVALPLIELREYPEMSIKLGVAGTENGKRGTETLSARISPGGATRSVRERPSTDAWALGTVDTWLKALVDGDGDRMRVGGNLDLVASCLKQLREVLCLRQPEPAGR